MMRANGSDFAGVCGNSPARFDLARGFWLILNACDARRASGPARRRFTDEALEFETMPKPMHAIAADAMHASPEKAMFVAA